MIRHGSLCTTVAPMMSCPMIQRMPISESNRAQGTLASRTNAASSLTPHKITLIGPAATLPDRQRLPARTVLKPFLTIDQCMGPTVPALEAFVRKRPKPFTI